MVEYIDKAVALSMREPPKSNRYYQTNNLDDAYEQGWDEALSCIEKISAADVAPVVHGRWVPFHSEVAGDIQYCSACEIGFDAKTDYCPNCGAKMDGELNEKYQ